MCEQLLLGEIGILSEYDDFDQFARLLVWNADGSYLSHAGV